MKITVYNIKGSTGKTPIAVNIAIDLEYAIVTNEKYHILDTIFPDDRVLQAPANEAFPEFPDDIDLVFDLGGFIEEGGSSIRSALEQSDCVIIPVNNELKALRNTLATIDEVKQFNPNIIIVATKLEKKDKLTGKWEAGEDFLNIQKVIHGITETEYPVLPLKLSKAFDTIFEEEKSIAQLVAGGGLPSYSFREVKAQFDNIYKYLEANYGK
jgi:cellulose biosynthesis protein BcsQ